ncbi:MAG: DUF2652 domain-containing protein [Anaeromyxobacteraceae bacterium]
MAPSVEPALLVIADIGGYTRFLREQRTSAAHAPVIVGELLEAVIEGARGFRLAKLEGDAAFLRSRSDPEALAGRLVDAVADAHRRFVRRRSAMVARNTCGCDACSQLSQLRLKFVSHLGEVVVHRVWRSEEVAGVDVILVHRMLKNEVPVDDYLLVTDPVLSRLGAAGAAAVRLEHEFEGLGRVPTAYLAVPAAAPEDEPAPSLARKLLARLVLEVRALPNRALPIPARP